LNALKGRNVNRPMQAVRCSMGEWGGGIVKKGGEGAPILRRLDENLCSIAEVGKMDSQACGSPRFTRDYATVSRVFLHLGYGVFH